MKKILALYIWIFAVGVAFAQEVTSVVDSTQIKIGAPLQYCIKATVNADAKVVFPNQPNFGDFEVLEQAPIDTLLKEQKMELIKKYVLTQFDSGSYAVPRLSVFVDGKNFQTDFHKIEVSNVEVDTLKQPLYDIKTPIAVDGITAQSYFKYLIGLLIVLILGVLTYFLIRWYQSKNLTEEDLFRTPLEKAVSQLTELDKKQWLLSGQIKDYYSELSDIIREYIEEVFDLPAKESTTKEVIMLLTKYIKKHKIQFSKEQVNLLHKVLDTADLVKFAKFQPNTYEVETNRKEVEEVAKGVDVAIPKFSEEQSAKVRLREQRYQKRKRIRIWLPIIVVLVGFSVVGIGYLVERLKETELNWFQTNQSLYEQEWVSADYGYPAFTLTTPEVLMRKELPTAKNENAPQEAIFAYENDKTKLNVVVQTQVMDTKDINLEEVLKTKLKYMEQTLLFTQLNQSAKTFNHNQVEGIQSTGTYQKTVNEKPIKMVFELLIFAQKEGTQLLWVSYPEEDEYGAKISQRIIENIQLNVVQENE